MMIREIKHIQAETTTTPDSTEVSQQKIEFDYLRTVEVVHVLCQHVI